MVVLHELGYIISNMVCVFECCENIYLFTDKKFKYWDLQ